MNVPSTVPMCLVPLPASPRGPRSEDGTSARRGAHPAGAGLHPAGTRLRPAVERLPSLRSEEGAVTAEYAITTIAAVAFAGVLVTIMQSEEVRGFLVGLIQGALSVS